MGGRGSDDYRDIPDGQISRGMMNGDPKNSLIPNTFLGDLLHFLDGHGSVSRKVKTNHLFVLCAVAHRAYKNAYSATRFVRYEVLALLGR